MEADTKSKHTSLVRRLEAMQMYLFVDIYTKEFNSHRICKSCWAKGTYKNVSKYYKDNYNNK